MGRVQLEDNSWIEYNDEWSFKILNNRPCQELPNDIVVYASDFSQEIPDSIVFRDDLRGVTFIKCNLSNVIIPNQGGG